MATGKNSLNNSVVLVTGGSGILGSAVVAELLSIGAFVCSLDANSSKDLAKLPNQQNLVQYECDVSDSDQVHESIRKIEEDHGQIVGLHNNAATKTSDLGRFLQDVEEYDVHTWNEVMATNLLGMFLVAREAGQAMAQRGMGSIVQTASIYGATMGPDQRIYEGSEYLGRRLSSPVSYTVSKAGVHGLTNHLATYWGSQGVRVNTVTPGGIKSGQNKTFENQYSARVPLGRMATAEEVSHAVVFLLSDSASYITGQNLFVDGGLSAW